MLELPTAVKGPTTRWFVRIEHYGKNGSKAALVANCLSNGKSVTLYDGRAAVTEGVARSGFLVEIGTIKAKLAAAMVAQGCAEFVDESAPFEPHQSL